MKHITTYSHWWTTSPPRLTYNQSTLQEWQCKYGVPLEHQVHRTAATPSQTRPNPKNVVKMGSLAGRPAWVYEIVRWGLGLIHSFCGGLYCHLDKPVYSGT